MRARKKKWTDPYLREHPNLISVGASFPYILKPKQVNVLEIGTGKGDFISRMAVRYPKYNWCGIEKSADIIALALKKIVEANIKNVRFVNGDMGEIKEEIKDNSFDFIFISHPDPWPKKKNAKRRLTHPHYLECYLRILKPDGCLYFKTDNTKLYEDSLEFIEEFGKLKLINKTDDYDNKLDFDTLTEYETKFRNEGIKIKRIILQKEETLND